MKYFTTLIVSILFFGLNAQDSNLKNYNYIYKDNIRSVRFHLSDLLLSIPVYDINSSGQLRLSFDDLDGDAKDYVYTVVHCDRNWEPSNLSDMEYIDGFTEERIDNYSFSFKTINNFTHYELFLPNDNMSVTKSGNYLLKVYEDEDEKTLALTRRFMVVDSKVTITPQVVAPSQAGKFRTHQEIDFVVEHPKLKSRSPQQDFRAVVLQNGRWDNAVTDLSPLFIRSNAVTFDYQNKIVFPAGKEFRYLDLRSLRFRSENIIEIQEYQNAFEVILEKDEKRFNQVYFSREDINGNFVIETIDQNNMDLASNYAKVLFSLYSPVPLHDQNIYLFGALSDWQLKDEFKMVYNEAVNSYVVKVPLKQGFYNYAYVTTPIGAKNPQPDFAEIEGNWYETENEYTILIYYYPFGERYEQLVGLITFSSSR